MQDSDPKQNNKQYFDIMSSPKPNPTSRPVINNDPVQSDPMVSTTTAGVAASQTTKAEQSEVGESIGAPIVAVPQENTTPPSPEENITVDIPEVPGDADPDAVQYEVPTKPNTEEPVQPNDVDADKLLENTAPTNTNVEVPGDTNNAQPEPSQSSPEQAQTQTTTEAQPTIDSTPTQAVQSQHVVSHNPKSKKALIKTIIGIIILIILIVAAFLVYKYKIGK